MDFLFNMIKFDLRYQFFFPHDPINVQFQEKCKEYKENLEKRKNLKEKYGDI